VAKLRILRGETTHAEFELKGQTARIGRSSENEIVLEDPGKGVSRTHAVIRFDEGRYILVDNKSQNGIWVSGSRVASVVLAPRVVASVGPFRLMIETPADEETESARDPHTEEVRPSGSPTGLPLDDGRQFSEPPSLSPRATDLMKVRRWYEEPRTWAITGAAVSLFAASAFAVYVFLLKRPPFDLVVAEAMVIGGQCQEAIVKHIDPALRANPNDPMALYLRGLCTQQPPSDVDERVPSPSPSTATQLLDEAEAFITAGACQPGLDKITQVLAIESTNERASQLAERARSCINQPLTPAPTPTTILAVRRPPSEGGLGLLSKELEKDYRARMLAMRARYDAAVSALQKGEHLQAAREFEQIGREVPDGYLELAQQLAAAHQGIKGEAQNRLDAAQAAESRGDFDAATDAYRRAHELDPEIEIDAQMQRLAENKIKLGRKRCEAGKLEYSYGTNRAAAIAAFQEVVKLLPPSDPCYAIAQERLRQLGQ
jgi:tetratricopeptide (TPR) repeat protein